MRRLWLFVSLWIPLALAGCSGSQPAGTPAAESSSESTAATPVATAAAQANPQDVVAHFLEALRRGDVEGVEGLLTERARTELPKHNLRVEPIGSPDVEFAVGRVETHKDNPALAYVSCTWKEPSAAAGVESYEVVWIMRQESAGWRIAGMAMEGLDQQPVVFNFEDPAEMQRQREALAAAYEQQEHATASAASGSPAGSDAVRR